jgi:hypothetical protein
MSYSPTIALTQDRLRRLTSSLAHADECDHPQLAGRICLLRVERRNLEPVSKMNTFTKVGILAGAVLSVVQLVLPDLDILSRIPMGRIPATSYRLATRDQACD